MRQQKLLVHASAALVHKFCCPPVSTWNDLASTADAGPGNTSSPKEEGKIHPRREAKGYKVLFDNRKNLYWASKQFSVNTKNILRWLHSEEWVRASSKGWKRVDFQRTHCTRRWKRNSTVSTKTCVRRGWKLELVVLHLRKTISFWDGPYSSTVW